MNRLKLFCAVIIFFFAAVEAGAQELLVSAAASLTHVFKAIGAEFERTHRGTKVIFNFAASDILVKQIAEGAPVDVLASADQEAMDRAAKTNIIVASTRINFAANRLVVAVPKDSPLQLATLEELSLHMVKRIAISQPATVPVGRYAKAVLDKARLWTLLQDRLVFTQNVRQSLDYLARGEVDAGFVYSTDVEVMKDRVRSALEVTTTRPVWYPIAVTSTSKNPKPAREFVAFVASDAGQSILLKFGFAKP